MGAVRERVLTWEHFYYNYIILYVYKDHYFYNIDNVRVIVYIEYCIIYCVNIRHKLVVNCK